MGSVQAKRHLNVSLRLLKEMVSDCLSDQVTHSRTGRRISHGCGLVAIGIGA